MNLLTKDLHHSFSFVVDFRRRRREENSSAVHCSLCWEAQAQVCTHSFPAPDLYIRQCMGISVLAWWFELNCNIQHVLNLFLPPCCICVWPFIIKCSCWHPSPLTFLAWKLAISYFLKSSQHILLFHQNSITLVSWAFGRVGLPPGHTVLHANNGL